WYDASTSDYGVILHKGTLSLWSKDEPLRKQLCEAVQKRGYKLTENFDITLEVDFDLGDGGSSPTKSPSVSAMYITPINRDFNSADVISDAETARLTAETEGLCRDIQSEATKLGLQNVHVSIGQWDYIAGVRIFYSGSDCNNLEPYS